MDKLTRPDFLSDDLFIKWRLFRTEELDAYWNDYIERNPRVRPEIEEAIAKFGAVRINDNKLSQEDADMLFARIARTSALRLRRRKIMRYTAAAASVLLILVSVFTLQQLDRSIRVADNTIIGQHLPAEDISLISGDLVHRFKTNTSIDLSESKVIPAGEDSDAGELDLEAVPEMTHTLIIPKGKQFNLTLPDGTRAWLNSGSEMEFPSRFTGAERIIKVRGEVYLEVAPDAAKPFYVRTDDFTVRVLGTKFNVSSYGDGSESSVVLVEGKVGVLYGVGDAQELEPGELFGMSRGQARHIALPDANAYVNWMNGTLIFDKATVSSILEKVGRHYNVEFRHNNNGILGKTYSGKFSVSNTLEEALEVICVILNTDYRIVGETIYIDNKN